MNNDPLNPCQKCDGLGGFDASKEPEVYDEWITCVFCDGTGIAIEGDIFDPKRDALTPNQTGGWKMSGGFRGSAGSRDMSHGQWMRSEAQQQFHSIHHHDFHCGCPYGDAHIKTAIAVFQECREMCCDWAQSDEAKSIALTPSDGKK